jgi:hypothetical protein
MSSSRGNRCSKGKPCFTACVNRDFLCRLNLAERLKGPLRRIGDEISEKGTDVADHIGKNVAAWKTGKVLGNLVSSYLESRYGIPRDASVKLAETAIQGLAATGLDIKHIKNADEFSKKLFTELAAAFIGKSSHTGAELMLSAKEVSTIVETALPVLAGKISGIGTSMLASRLPTPRELLTMVQERSKDDMGKVQAFLRPYTSFAEMDDIAEVLGDVTLMVLVGLKGKMDAVKA